VPENDPLEDIPRIEVTIEIGDESLRRDINEDLRIDIDNLDEALIRQPALYAYYASLTQKANLLAENARHEYDKAVNQYATTAREELSEGSKRVTDKQIDSLIKSQPTILALHKRMIIAENNARTLWSLTKALDQKREALAQLCYNRRKEMEHLGLRVSAKPGVAPTREPPIGEGN